MGVYEHTQAELSTFHLKKIRLVLLLKLLLLTLQRLQRLVTFRVQRLIFLCLISFLSE